MASRNNTFLLKRSNIPGKVPSSGDLLLGELALNTSDAILYTSGTTENSILPIGWDRVARTGDTMTGSLFSPNLYATTVSATSINKVDYIVFNTGTTSAVTVAGTVYFDNTEKALSYNTSINQLVTVNLGQQSYIRVFNNSGSDIQRGKALEVLSAYSGLPSVTLAVNKKNSSNIVGVSSELIPNGKEGIAISYGVISDIELTGMTIGSLIYASNTTPGNLADATQYSNFPLSARTNQIGYVVQTGVTTGKMFVAINNENTVLSLTDLERNVLEGNVISTGAFEFTGLTTASTTTINIANLKGWIVKNTYENQTSPYVMYVEYSGGTNISLPNLTTADSTFILVTSASTILQQTTFPTPQQRRENIYLGKIVHQNRSTITAALNTVDFDVSPISALRDLWTPLKLINQDIIVSPNGANLNINTSAGTLWGNGIGWVSNQLNPNSVSLLGTSPTTFQYRVQTGGTFSNTITINPANWDNNGVLAAVGGGANESTNQRVYLFPTGLVRIQYGQKEYSSLSEAVAGVQTEAFVEYADNRDNAILIGVLSVKKNATQLNNTSQAIFNFVSKFGDVLGGTGGLSTTTLQQAYDNSTTPEIVINATLDGLSIKNGTLNADNITTLLEGINASGGVTSFVRADGYISATTLTTNGFTANTNGVSASTLNIKYIGSGTPLTNLGVDVFGNVISGVTGGSTFTGGTVTGPTFFTNGLTASTISATTYYNLPLDITITGGTYSAGVSTIIFTNNTGGTFSVTGITATGGGGGTFTGGTVTGATIFTNGLTANTISATSLTTDYIDFTKLPLTAYTHLEGRVHWNDNLKTLEIDTENSNVRLDVGHELVMRVNNQTGSPLLKGRAVYINGQQGQRPTVTYATYTSDATSAGVVGLVLDDINNNDNGYVISYGIIENVDTSAYSAGTPLYLFTGGTLTDVKPQAPLHDVRIGKVINSSVTGSIAVVIQNGYEIDELHDVRINDKVFGDLISLSAYNGSDVWVNTKTLNGSYTITGNTTVGGQVIAASVSATTFSAITSSLPISNTQVIYSNNGVLTGSTAMTWSNSATTLTINGTLEATSKSFSIAHPTKEGKKLVYGSLEGPENGVYHRGKLYNEDTIILPEYWSKLVDKDTVTIHLTPIGKHQDLFVKEILEDKIIIGIEGGLFTDKTINCFYVVYGERKDINKLEIER